MTLSSPCFHRKNLADTTTPSIGGTQALDALNSGGFASAVGANHAEDLSGSHIEGEIFDGDNRAIDFPQMFNVYTPWSILQTCLLAPLDLSLVPLVNRPSLRSP
jgi:hypothetical protein